MLKALVTLFTEASVLFYVLFGLTIVLLIAEVFIPKFSIAGYAGLLMGLCTITCRCANASNTANEIMLYIIYIVAMIVILVGFIKLMASLSLKKKDLKNYAIVDGKKIPLTKEGNLDFSFLLGKEGEVVADLKPTGKVLIEDSVYEVTATNEYLYTGTKVVVEKVVAQKVIVCKKD